LWKSAYKGIIVDCTGIINPERKMRKRRLFPLNLSRANPKEAGRARAKMEKIEVVTTIRLFRRARPMLESVHPSTNPWKLILLGRAQVSIKISGFVLNEE